MSSEGKADVSPTTPTASWVEETALGSVVKLNYSAFDPDGYELGASLPDLAPQMMSCCLCKHRWLMKNKEMEYLLKDRGTRPICLKCGGDPLS